MHAGLHKSGTTLVQHAFLQAWSEGPGAVYYPLPVGAGAGHATLLTPFVGAYVPSELEQREFVVEQLHEVVSRAEAAGTSHLILSCENLDLIEPQNTAMLIEALGRPADVALFTVTLPSMRWCSMWQEMVKHGHVETPVNSHPGLVRTEYGGLERLVTVFPASKKVVRVVRSAPREPGLSQAVARLLGLALTPVDESSLPGNLSMGRSVELLRRLNGLDVRLERSDTVAARLGDAWLPEFWRGTTIGPLAEDFVLPPELQAAATAEKLFLEEVGRGLGRTIVVDPHDELGRWDSLDVPGWFGELARSAWTPDDADLLALRKALRNDADFGLETRVLLREYEIHERDG